MTDGTLGMTPLGVVAQTNHWVGDIFLLLPGFDGSAEVAGDGGTIGTATARCGTTVYGPTGETRTINLFMADTAVTAIFGAATSEGDLSGFTETTAQGETVSDTTTAWTGVADKQITFDYTFASPKDVAFGIDTGAGSGGGAGSSSGGGAINPLLLLGLMLTPFFRRRRFN